MIKEMLLVWATTMLAAQRDEMIWRTDSLQRLQSVMTCTRTHNVYFSSLA